MNFEPRQPAASSAARPPSAVSGGVGMTGILGLAAGAWLSLSVDWPYTLRALLVLSVTAAPMIVLEVLRRRALEPHAGRHGRTAFMARLGRTLRRMLGLALTLALFVPAYSVLNWVGDTAAPLRLIYLMFALLTLALAAPTYWWKSADDDRADAAWRLGDALLVWRFPALDETIWEHLRQWTLKCFFIPFLFWATSINLVALEKVARNQATIGDWFVVAHHFIFLLDVAIGCIGYFVTVRAFGSHIRSTNPYWRAWLACLVCYPPFWPVMYDAMLDYDRNGDWLAFMSGIGGPAFYTWAGAIVFLELVYVWATVIFGIRFSNLTNRGILTNGPYRWVKHPAYLAKNLSWWLWTLPFVPVAGWGDAAWATAQLAILNMIYFARARTEEWHLREDPAYVAYEAWMRDNDLFALVRRGAGALAVRLPFALARRGSA